MSIRFFSLNSFNNIRYPCNKKGQEAAMDCKSKEGERMRSREFNTDNILSQSESNPAPWKANNIPLGVSFSQRHVHLFMFHIPQHVLHA